MRVQRYKRVRSKKRKFRFLKSRFFWYFVFFLIFLIGISYLFLFSPFFQIKEIKVFGVEKSLENSIKEILQAKIKKKILFWETKSIFLVDSKNLQKELLHSFPSFSEAEIKRDFLKRNFLFVEIRKREPIALFCQDKKYFFLDKEGVIFGESPELNENVLLILKETPSDIVFGKNIIEKDVIEKTLKIKSKLQEKMNLPIEKILIKESKTIDVQTQEKWHIYFNLKRDVNWQITELEAILKEMIPSDKRKNLKYIDLRFNKVYIFPEDYDKE